MTGLSRILGLFRDMCFAWFFGASPLTDVFFIAFKIPNFFRRLFAEGAFAQSFVPVLAEYKTHKNFAELQTFIGATASSLAIILSVLSLLVIVFSQWISIVFAPGFINDPVKLDLIGKALQITFPYLFFIALTAFASSILNTFKHFAVPAAAPLILNLCLIGATFLSAFSVLSTDTYQPVITLSWAVFLAGVLQLLLQVPLLLKLKLFPAFSLNFCRTFANPGVKKVIRLMIPTLFAVSVTQISLLTDTILASFLISGSVSWLYYADRLVELPLGLLAIAIATVIMPSLSSTHQQQDRQAFVHTLEWAVRTVIFIGLPACIGLIILAEPLISTLFGYQAMTETDVIQTTASLRAYALGLLAFMLIKIFGPAYFSQQNTKTPVKIGITASLANIGLSLLFILPLAHVGLALATSLAALLNAGLLAYGLWQRKLLVFDKSQLKYYVKIFTASVIMALVLCVLLAYLKPYFHADILARWLSLLGTCLIGMSFYFFIARLLGLKLTSI